MLFDSSWPTRKPKVKPSRKERENLTGRNNSTWTCWSDNQRCWKSVSVRRVILWTSFITAFESICPNWPTIKHIELWKRSEHNPTQRRLTCCWPSQVHVRISYRTKVCCKSTMNWSVPVFVAFHHVYAKEYCLFLFPKQKSKQSFGDMSHIGNLVVKGQLFMIFVMFRLGF